MFNSSVIDVGIGLMFVYLILGLMCTAVNEWVAQWFKLRAKTLKEGIDRMVPALAEDFHKHVLVQSMSKAGHSPSYLPARTFAAVITDLLAKRAAGATDPMAAFQSAVDALPDGSTKESLRLLLKNAGNHAEVFEKNLETWFDDAMDRASGWYKKRLQIITACVAVGVTIFANADTVQIARKLFVNPTLRDKIVQEAAAAKRPGEQVNVEYSDNNPIPTAPIIGAPPASETPGLTAQQKADLGELTGWSSEFRTFHRMAAEDDKKPQAEIDAASNNDSFPGGELARLNITVPWIWYVFPVHLLGWFLTAVAASLGAPFWFDTLNKFMNVRSTGTSPDEKKKDQSKV